MDTNPATHHFWEAAGSSNALWPNLNTWPTNQLPVRQAIDLAINRTVIGSEGESGLESPLTNASGITLPTYQAWAGPVASLTVPATGDVAAAKAILVKAGYKMGSNGYFEIGGKTLALSLVDPSSYTDYAQDDALIAQQLRAAGIDVTFNGLTVNAWNADVADGDFQLTLHWGNGGVTPYNLYDNWLDDTLVSSTGATGDYERLKDPTIQSDLAALSAAPDGGRADHRAGPDREVRRGEPAGHPDHHRGGLVRVQLAELRRLADPGRPVRQRAALGHQQRRGHRQRRGCDPAPHAGQLISHE